MITRGMKRRASVSGPPRSAKADKARKRAKQARKMQRGAYRGS